MFSVVIPLYNKAAEIERCLASVLAQTCAHFEVIVVDDGSTDNSAAKVNGFTDSRIRLIQQPNGGVAEARNRGIQEAGEWVAFLDADDTWHPEHLQNLLDLRTRYPDAAFLFTAYWVQRGALHRRIGMRVSGVTAAVDYLAIPDGRLIPSCTAMTRSALLEVGGYREMFGEDVDLWFRIGARHRTAYSTRATAVWHLDAANRRCDAEAASTGKYQPGSLLKSVELLAALGDATAASRALSYVRRRERAVIVKTLRSGDRDHAVYLRAWWGYMFQREDSSLDRMLSLPIALHRSAGRVLGVVQRIRTLMGYTIDRLVPAPVKARARSRDLLALATSAQRLSASV